MTPDALTDIKTELRSKHTNAKMVNLFVAETSPRRYSVRMYWVFDELKYKRIPSAATLFITHDRAEAEMFVLMRQHITDPLDLLAELAYKQRARVSR